MKPPPQVPNSTSSFLSSPSENFSFHSSPEAFLASRILQHHKDHPEDVEERHPVRAKILNRNVIILSSYHHIRQVLDPDSGGDGREPPFVAVEPYDQLMTPFFPPPNLLLNDGASHNTMRKTWQPCSHALASLAASPNLQTLIRSHLGSLPLSRPIDLYSTLKNLTWHIYLSIFLDLSPSDPAFDQIVHLQEDLLRGQFSLLPVSVNVGLWHSPRNKGIAARQHLQKLLEEHLATKQPAWLAHSSLLASANPQEIVHHALMATSSLAVKATASFLLAFLLNMFVYRPDQPEARSWSHSAEISTPDERDRRIVSVVQETLRLSPPIVGVMRRANDEQVLSSGNETEADVLVPQGWDVWCYFPGANREKAVYGIAEDQELLRPIRFSSKIRAEDRPPAPLAFGAGPKSCLGEPFVRQVARAVYEGFASAGLELQGDMQDKGVRGWLGWEVASPEAWAKGMKQLPTQRPGKAVMVRVERTQRVFWKDPSTGVDVTKV